MIRLYNTKTRTKVDFETLERGKVGMYAVSYTHLRAHETGRISYAVFCLKKKKKK